MKRSQPSLRSTVVRALMLAWGLLSAPSTFAAGPVFERAPWFEAFKARADDVALYRFLYAMPKGGDLHHHLSGGAFPEWYWDLALAGEAQGYRYLTKVRINDCGYGTDEFSGQPYLLYFHTISEQRWQGLDACRQGEYEPLEALTLAQKQAWHDALVLEQPYEGRGEFFEAHWARMDDLLANPALVAELVALNLKHFAAEGVRYLEAQVPLFSLATPEGKPLPPEAGLSAIRTRLRQPDLASLPITFRMQLSVLRFLPNAEEALARAYALAAREPDIVAVNFVGREDNDKGYPLRFLAPLRALRRGHGALPLSIHAGEVDEPNRHVRDTLLLGAQRIGHGVNLIHDPDTMLVLRGGDTLVEINLISNLLLNYVDRYEDHPFPEYLRFGIPVALSTDDRGMWDSTLTDEFFVAVKHFDLSFEEVVALSRASLTHSFLPEAEKARLLADYDDALARFVARFLSGGLGAAAPEAHPPYRGFICRRYGLCPPESAP
jgi:adenosine deaminase CECR1